MPLLSIITINYNNAEGLRKTMESVLKQTSKDFEYIVVDGGSSDTSCQVIYQQLAVDSSNEQLASYVEVNGIKVRWVSEKDSGIYNAMNKGICMAKGEYVQFLNSGDLLAANDVTEKMLRHLQNIYKGNKSIVEIPILYGNMLKPYKGRILKDNGFAGRQPTMLDFYNGTLNHSSTYIKRSLFDKYGLYDESLKIVSDWKWYLQVIGFNRIQITYLDINVTIFDMTGISSVNSSLDIAERRKVLEESLTLSILSDYDQYAFAFNQLNRINRYWITRKVFFLTERMIFKFEKWFRNKE